MKAATARRAEQLRMDEARIHARPTEAQRAYRQCRRYLAEIREWLADSPGMVDVCLHNARYWRTLARLYRRGLAWDDVCNEGGLALACANHGVTP